MIQSKKIIGRRDYWIVNVHYVEFQCKRRYIIENDINSEEGVESLSDAVNWFEEFVSENERDLAFADGEISHLRVAIVEDEDGDQEDDWNDIEEVGSRSRHWDRSDLDDDTVEESDQDEISD